MLDILRKEPLGGVLWMGTAKDEEEVRAIFKKLRAVSPGVWFCFVSGFEAEKQSFFLVVPFRCCDGAHRFSETQQA